jgi:short-subunit dehydrogenase
MKPISAEYAAECGIKAALSGKLIAIPGLMIKLGSYGAKMLPHSLVARVTYKMQERKKGV